MGILEKVLPIITGNNIYFSSLLHISMSALITLDVRQLLPGRICCPGSLGYVSPRDDQNPTETEEPVLIKGTRNNSWGKKTRRRQCFPPRLCLAVKISLEYLNLLLFVILRIFFWSP